MREISWPEAFLVVSFFFSVCLLLWIGLKYTREETTTYYCKKPSPDTKEGE